MNLSFVFPPFTIETIFPKREMSLHAESDAVLMGWEQRRRNRQRVRSVKGRGLALELPTGTVLQDGDLLYAEQDLCIAVKAKMEDLLVTPLNDAGRVAILAYELGNRNLPVSIRHGFLATPYNRLVEALLEKMGVPYEWERGKFEPMSAHHHHG